MSTRPVERKVLLLGESWFIHSIHQKGFDSFTTSTYEEGCQQFKAALEGLGWQVDHVPSHLIEYRMPETLRDLQKYGVVIVSDVGANTFALTRATFVDGRSASDRLELIKAFVAAGGGLLMVGGYLSFSGIEGKAGYGRSCLAEVLPVTIRSGDDRVERPGGVVPQVVDPVHQIVAGMPSRWPYLLGYNHLSARPGASVLARCGIDPLLAVSAYGQGRCAAFASDLGPHWASADFMRWEHYGSLWDRILNWLVQAATIVAPGSDGSTVLKPGQED